MSYDTSSNYYKLISDQFTETMNRNCSYHIKIDLVTEIIHMVPIIYK